MSTRFLGAPSLVDSAVLADGMGCRLLGGNEVDDQSVLDQGLRESHEGLMGGVLEVEVAGFFAVETEDPAMGVAFVETLGAGVCSPLEAIDDFDLQPEVSELGAKVVDLLGRSVLLELEVDDMANRAFCKSGGGDHGKSCEGDEILHAGAQGVGE